MYSNKENVNILTALLVRHGVGHAVVCPGSRNAPIVHNLSECPEIKCYPVTDERSAGFYALGMAQATHAPVAVCVTSGTALLNLAPAVAEAYYQHVPLVVVSADRPSQWIGQLDGQTLPQPDALGRFVKKAVTLPEPRDEEERWYCNRLVNEALAEVRHHGLGPVHINVPISEPLFRFDVPELPDERFFVLLHPHCDDRVLGACVGDFLSAERPMIVIGQLSTEGLLKEELHAISQCCVVLNESLSVDGGQRFDEVLYHLEDADDYQPDYLLYIGDTLVSKRLKRFLRQNSHAAVWAVTEDGCIHDTFMHVCGVIEGHPADVIDALVRLGGRKALSDTEDFRRRWKIALRRADERNARYVPGFSQMAAVRYLERRIQGMADECYVHYANSSAVRLANIYARHYVYCNRGVNGIEGTLSTAAGFSVVTEGSVFCVIGDLSFFYDQNALWNQNLRGNLRILLLNNGRGGIFNQLHGLEQSPARDSYVAAEHHTTAEGICLQNDVIYLKAVDMEQMELGIDQLVALESERPVLLEVFTDAGEDARILREYYY